MYWQITFLFLFPTGRPWGCLRAPIWHFADTYPGLLGDASAQIWLLLVSDLRWSGRKPRCSPYSAALP